MAKKKNQSKKHKFKYSEPTTGTTERAPEKAAPSVSRSTTTRPAAAAAAPTTRDFSYVFSDVKRIGILMTALVALELVLWYLFNHTGVGDTVREMVKL